MVSHSSEGVSVASFLENIGCKLVVIAGKRLLCSCIPGGCPAGLSVLFQAWPLR